MGPVVVLAAITMLLQLGGEPTIEAFRLEAAAVAGEPWRLVTGHWVHLTWSHWGLNLVTLAVFAGLLEPLGRARAFVALLGGATVGVDLGILVRHPEADWYVGLSGALYGMIAGAAILERRPQRAAAVMIGLAVKLLSDHALGTSSLTEAWVGGPVLAEAHVYGVIGGAATATLILAWSVRWSRQA